MSLVIFDTETGGLEAHHPTIQIAAIAVDDDWTEVAAFERKLRFDIAACDPESLKLNSYDPAAWARDCVNPVDAMRGFADFLRDHADCNKVSRGGKPYTVARLCGHNAASFDLPRVSTAFRQMSLFFPGDFGVLDSLQLYRWSRHLTPQSPGPESGRLGDIAAFYGISIEGAHDALTDCRLVAAIAPKLLESVRPVGV